MGFHMNEDDLKQFLEDFKKAELEQKLDMWFYAMEQEGIWEEIIADMAAIAEEQKMSNVLEKMKKN
jgi:hypothetical protein